MRKFKVGDEFEGVVSDFGMSGEGIVKDGAYPVFVPFAAVGEGCASALSTQRKILHSANLSRF